ncbi:MAG: LysR family transcriptional regulator [Clostridia bacterium]|nr:LysR family transcriptional regulator [Clostridia bacterium]
MNLLQLKYAVEVERTGSVTRAAENLFMGQPNLSRSIKELEESLGMVIFRRTAKGLTPTPEGEEFLAEAKTLLEQFDEFEERFSGGGESVASRMNISVPRSDYIVEAFTRVMRDAPPVPACALRFRETNSMRAINNLVEGNYTLAIVRYYLNFEPQYLSMLNDRELSHEEIFTYHPVLLVSAESPLAKLEPDMPLPDDLIELAYGDPYAPGVPFSQTKRTIFTDRPRRIFVYSRASRDDVLHAMPNSFIWDTPAPAAVLARHGLVALNRPTERRYRDLLIYRRGYHRSEVEQGFFAELDRIKAEMGQ